MTVLVTGGAGYIGSHTTQELKKQNIRVVAVDNLSTGYKPSARFADAFYEVDILDSEKLKQIFIQEKPNLVMHFAAKLSVPESCTRVEFYEKNNVQGTQTLLKLCEEHVVSQFVFSSSVAVYGEGQGRGLIQEGHKALPMSPYGQTKLQCENLLSEMSTRNNNFKYRILRYANVSGAPENKSNGPFNWQSGQLIHNLCRAALSDLKVKVCGDSFATHDGTCIRDYIHVVDLAEAHVVAMDSFKKPDQAIVWNCSYNTGYTVLEVVNAFERANGIKFELQFTEPRPGDPAVVTSDNTKLKTETLWEPRFNNLELICKSTFDWALKHREFVLSTARL